MRGVVVYRIISPNTYFEICKFLRGLDYPDETNCAERSESLSFRHKATARPLCS